MHACLLAQFRISPSRIRRGVRQEHDRAHASLGYAVLNCLFGILCSIGHSYLFESRCKPVRLEDRELAVFLAVVQT
jgi:hypothetical protein